MIELILFAITLIGLLIATYTDFKQRIVPDWVSYGMIILGLALHAFYSFTTNNYSHITFSAVATVSTFIGALALWKLGFWAGGDVKLFTGIAALNPVNYAAIRNLLGLHGELFSTVNLPVFTSMLFLYSVYALLPIGLVVGLKKIFSDKEATNTLKKTLAKTARKTLFFALLAAGINQVSTQLGLHFLAPIAGVILIVFFAGKLFEALSIVFFAIGFALNQAIAIEAGIVFAIGFLLFSLLRVLFLARSGLGTKVPVEKLEEGMIPATTLIEKNGQVIEHRVSIKSILKHVKENNVEALKEMLSPTGKTIVSSSQADGLTVEQVKELQRLSAEGLIGKELKIKESTAFVPAILAAYIVLAATGDLLINVVF